MSALGAVTRIGAFTLAIEKKIIINKIWKQN